MIRVSPIQEGNGDDYFPPLEPDFPGGVVFLIVGEGKFVKQSISGQAIADVDEKMLGDVVFTPMLREWRRLAT